MNQPKPTAEEIYSWQKRLAAQANNRAWHLFESTSRSPDESEEMLHAAHGGDGSTPRRSRLPALAGATVGAVGAVAFIHRFGSSQ